MRPDEGRVSLDALQDVASAGEVDTVVLALTDMQGRLQGKRLTAEHFLDGNADVELRAFDAAVTDRERYRGFERL